MAILVPDEKLDCFGIMRKKFGLDKIGLAFYPGPVLPPRPDGSTLKMSLAGPLNKLKKFLSTTIELENDRVHLNQSGFFRLI